MFLRLPEKTRHLHVRFHAASPVLPAGYLPWAPDIDIGKTL
jgi:hypothetical protein